MRIAIISDIHGNCIALESVLNDLKAEHIDHMVCLGDVATDGPQPREVVAQLKALNGPVMMGNMDDWMLNPPPRNRTASCAFRHRLPGQISTRQRDATRRLVVDIAVWPRDQKLLLTVPD